MSHVTPEGDRSHELIIYPSGGSEPRSISLTERDADAWAQAREVLAGDPDAVLQLPDASAVGLCSLGAGGLIEACAADYRWRIHDHDYDDLFEAVLAAMPGTDDPPAHKSAYRGLLRVAKWVHRDTLHLAIELIRRRLKELGVSAPAKGELRKRILHGEAVDGVEEDAPPQINAREAAAEYLAFLRRTSVGPDEVTVPADGGGILTDDDEIPEMVPAPVLWRYRDEWHAWTGAGWETIPEGRLRGRIMDFLQHRPDTPPGGRFLSDVVTELTGYAHLDIRGDPSPPFQVRHTPTTLMLTSDDASPQTDDGAAPPKIMRTILGRTVADNTPRIAFRNGIATVDALVADSHARLETLDPWWFGPVVPYEYDPAATCPRFLRFLDEVLPRTGDGDRRQQVLQEYMGLSLTPDVSYERMLIMVGEGKNGKSKLCNAWRRMLGEDNVANLPYPNLGDDFRLITLENRLANFSIELDHLGRSNERILKALISGDVLQANRKNRQPIDMTSQAKLIVATNHLPQFVDDTDAIWRRLIVMPWRVQITDEQLDRTLDDQLAAEIPGIMNWALEGLQRLRSQGEFTCCDGCDAAQAQHEIDSDSVSRFAVACLQPAPNPDTARPILARRLYEVYVHYCRLTGAKPLGFRGRSGFSARIGKLYDVESERIVTPDGRLQALLGLALTDEGIEYRDRYATVTPGWQGLYPDVPMTAQGG